MSRLGLACAWWLGLIATTAAQPATSPRAVHVVLDDNYPPYVFKDGEGHLQGITVDQWRLWETKTGRPAELHAMDWGEALRRMRAGEFDVIDTIFRTAERSTFLEFTPAYARLEVPIFFRREISGITDLASLRGFPVAAKTGDAAVDLLQENGVAPVLLFNNYEAIIAAAQEHKVSVFVVDRPPALYLLNKHGIADDFRMSAPTQTGEFHRAVHRGNTALLREIERGFAAITPEELGRIDEKWFGRTVSDRRYLGYVAYAAAGIALVVALLAGWNWSLGRKVRLRTRELRESQALLDGVVSHSPSMIFVKDLQGRYLLTNEHFCTVFGAGRKTLTGKSDFDLFPPDVAVHFQHDDRAVADSGTPRSIEETAPHATGPRHYLTVKFPLRDPQGRVFAVAGIASDITERRKDEDVQRATELRLIQAFRSSPVAVIISRRRDRVVIDVNDAFTHLTGWTRAEAVDRTLPELNIVEPATMDKIRRTLDEGKAVQDLELTARTRSGEIRHALGGMERIELNSEPHVVSTFVDITARKQAEEQLQISEERLRQAIRCAQIGIFDHDHRTDTIFWSPQQRLIHGWSADEAVRLEDYIATVFPEDRARIADAVRRAHDPQGDGLFDVELRLTRRNDGEVRWVGTRSQTFFAGEGAARRPIRTVGAVTDITDAKRADAALRHSEARFRRIMESDMTGMLFWNSQPSHSAGPLREPARL